MVPPQRSPVFDRFSRELRRWIIILPPPLSDEQSYRSYDERWKTSPHPVIANLFVAQLAPRLGANPERRLRF
jgi:hypothetical protein